MKKLAASLMLLFFLAVIGLALYACHVTYFS